MSINSPASSRSNIFFMLVSAALFGYFGFGTTWIHTRQVTGAFLLFVALLDWTLKGACIGFVASAAVTMALPWLGNFLYCLISFASAVMFVVVAIMDYMDTQHSALDPIILLLFAAWNGYQSWAGIRQLMRVRPAPHTLEPPFAAANR